VVADRNRLLKHMQRARIVLLSTERLPVLEMARRANVSRLEVGEATGAGCCLLVCRLLTRSPWLNPIEPRWAHSKRAVVELERKLTGEGNRCLRSTLQVG
jgi:hypothetical protein